METQLEGLEVTAEGIDANMANSAHHEMTLISKGRMRRLLEELYAFLYFQQERPYSHIFLLQMAQSLK